MYVSIDKNSPIGVFDSGVGGLTVVKEIVKRLPGERIIYFGDTANVPYGEKTAEELIRLADNIAAFLVARGVKAVVDACNSTSAVALEYLQERYDVPFIGVIEAGVKGALNATKNGKVGIIATKPTIDSRAHKRLAKKLDPGVEVFGQVCSLFVPLVEAGRVSGPETALAAEIYLAPLQKKEIDTLILGCTHYPFLAPVIGKTMGPHVTLVDPAENTVKELEKLLQGQINDNGPSTFADHEYFVSGDPVSFKDIGEKLIGASLGKVYQQLL
jgi:glutamate racemase